MKTIQLTQGQVAFVDDADYEAVSQFKWCVSRKRRCFYAVRGIRKPDGTWAIQYMHRFLMPGVAEVDHRDGNGLNNQREDNLRPATIRQNKRGFRRKSVNKTSQFRGVSWGQQRRKWQAAIMVDGKSILLGRFACEFDAARAYNEAALKYFGDFAHLNVIP